MMRIRRLFQIVLFMFMAPVSVACAESSTEEQPSETVAIIESDEARHRFNIEYVVEYEELMRGLMHRTELAQDAGMLFDFQEPKPISMWMKNTLIPLDMAFIDENGVIITIAENTTPLSLESIPSGGPILGVLEVNGGLLRELGVKVGDKVRHPMFDKPQGPAP